jgi:mRNA interferase RelE/StbE
MTYEVVIDRSALKSLQKIPFHDQNKIVAVIDQLASKPRPFGAKKLVGREGWRARVGSYRLLYDIDDDKKRVFVLDVGHRKDIYR